jgi:hypothetical protein
MGVRGGAERAATEGVEGGGKECSTDDGDEGDINAGSCSADGRGAGRAADASRGARERAWTAAAKGGTVV